METQVCTDEALAAKEENEGGGKDVEKVTGQPASESQRDSSGMTLGDFINKALSLDAHRESAESERVRLLERLVHKIQPELTKEEMTNRVTALMEKFRHFDLSDLRELVGADPEDKVGSSVVAEETLGKEERGLLEQMDEGTFAELEDEVTAELREKLSELGFPTEGRVIVTVRPLNKRVHSVLMLEHWRGGDLSECAEKQNASE